MPSDEGQHKEALWPWKDLRSARRFSVAPDVGITAIVVSTMIKPSTPPAQAEEERAAFRAEGQQLAARLEDEGARVELVDSTTHELARVVKDEKVCSIHTIGHGTLAHISNEDPLGPKLDWKTLSEATDHLKTGIFVQRQCGNRPNVLNVPLGLFVVGQPQNLYAANGVVLPNTPLTVADEMKLKPLFRDGRMPSYREIRGALPCDGSGALSAHAPKLHR